jgi:3alpha(or 20beta)-hydroxysteroid dehydrogenase
MPATGRVDGRVIIVTGAAQGQGAAGVAALAAEGAEVFAADLRMPAPAPHVHPVVLDIADPEGWDALVADVRDRFGRVDGLINNAAVTSRVRVGEIELEEWNRTLAVNLTGAMLGVQAVLPLMGTGGSIVNVGSMAALSGHYAAPYTVSKWGLRGLTHAASVELGPRGIRVNAVHPGYIETPMATSAPTAIMEATLAHTPLGRTGTVDDLAALMVFLMSDESGFISGVDIPVDGGLVAGGTAKSIGDAVRSVTA